MPGLDSDIHLNMLRGFRKKKISVHEAAKRGYAPVTAIDKAIKDRRLKPERTADGKRLLTIEALESQFGKPRGGIYGMKWGNPDAVPPLMYIRRNYIMPHVKPGSVGLEIGPGGGRWTQYLLSMKKLYVVDYHQELLDELKRNFSSPNIFPIRNNGTDFPGVPDGIVDFLLSFGVFVHLDPPIIEAYLVNMKRILNGNSVVFIQYADTTKVMARNRPRFADTNAESMRRMVEAAGYVITLEDNTSLWHSNVIMFSPK